MNTHDDDMRLRKPSQSITPASQVLEAQEMQVNRTLTPNNAVLAACLRQLRGIRRMGFEDHNSLKMQHSLSLSLSVSFFVSLSLSLS